MSEPTTPTQMMEDLNLLADHLQQVSARLGSAERQTLRRPSSMDTHAAIHISPREALTSSRPLRSSSKQSSPVTSAAGREPESHASTQSSSGPKKSSKKSGKTSSRRSSSSRSSRSQPGLLSPEGLLKVALIQDQVAADQKQRTLARIGELYLEQNKVSDRGMSQQGSDDDSASNSESSGSSSNSRPQYYGGYNATYVAANDGCGQPSRTPGASMEAPRSDHEIGREVSISERNDAVVAMPSTGMKKNITVRRSQGRPRDRNSIGGTSKPVESLLSKRQKPRMQDVNYVNELAAPRSASTPLTRELMSDDRSRGMPDFTRRHLPDETDDPLIYDALYSQWAEKKGVEEDMKQALLDQNKDVYHLLETRYDALNAQMFAVLQSAISQRLVPAQSNLPEEVSEVSRAARRKPDAPVNVAVRGMYDGNSYVIYLDYQDDVVPWVVWAHMPTLLLIQAAVNILSGMGIAVSQSEIVLFHNNQPMEPNGGCLSDHPVLVNESVFIIVNPIQRESQNRCGAMSREYRKCERAIRTERGMTDGFTPARSAIGEIQHLVNPDQGGLLHQVEGLHDSVFTVNNRGRPGMTFQPNLVNRNTNRSLPGERHVSSPVHGEESGSPGSRAHDKIKQSFKCPRFSGQSKDWKLWNKGFLRYLSIWDLDYVVDPNFFVDTPIPESKIRDNKLVFYILEDATQGSPLASAYIRQAPEKNGFEAYYTLLDGFVFAGTTTSTILLNELANFRFKSDETPSELILRLEELFQDLQMIPGDAAMTFNDTQCINYLLGALRHEPQWDTVASAITSSQIKGEITFRQACDELRL